MRGNCVPPAFMSSLTCAGTIQLGMPPWGLRVPQHPPQDSAQRWGAGLVSHSMLGTEYKQSLNR